VTFAAYLLIGTVAAVYLGGFAALLTVERDERRPLLSAVLAALIWPVALARLAKGRG
jgi:hypothetical protein